MKQNANIPPPGTASPAPRPPPFLHPSSEPEYDTAQLARRAAALTGVLEHILEEHPAPVDPGMGPLGPAQPPPPASI